MLTSLDVKNYAKFGDESYLDSSKTFPLYHQQWLVGCPKYLKKLGLLDQRGIPVKY